MSVDIHPDCVEKYMKTVEKFHLMEAQKPKFTNDCDYVDYALSVLQRSVMTPLGTFPNDLEGTEGLVKSPLRSEDIRSLGNIIFKAGNLFEAHNLYTASIAVARTGSRELALAYGNRSAVLLEKQYYKECLEDIQRAFDNNYPPTKRDKLLKRQAKAKELLPTQKKVLYHNEIPTIKSKNVGMPSASECIKINKNKEFGRHIVANRTINPGEILLVEKPYSQFVFPENRFIHCSECLEVCYNMIPCEKCSGVLYCSKACRRKAYVDYHRYECAILSHFGYDIINWNATRMTLKGLGEYDKEDTDPNVYRSDRYKEISALTLCMGKREIVILIKAAGAAKVFYALKKYTDIFTAFDVDNKENALKTLLLKNIFIDQCNSVLVKKRVEVLSMGVGRAIYSTLAMFNHECNENVGYSFYGSTVVLRAVKKIQTGEQCFINYGVNPSTTVKKIRQEYIKGIYNFTCKCQACVQNWPRLEMLSAETSLLMPHFTSIYAAVVFCNDFDEYRKNMLLQETLNIIEKIEPEAPVMTYRDSRDIFAKIMLEGNTFISF